MGDWFNMIALMIVVYNVTESGLMVSLSLMTKALPSLLIGPFAGVIIDRANRKMIMMMSHAINAILVLFLMLAQDYIWIVFIINTLTASVSVFFAPARQSVIPQVVEREQLSVANTLSSTTWGVMSVLGASLGGVISQYLGVQAIFILDSATFIIALLLVWITDIPMIQSTGRKVRFFQDLKDGYVYVYKNPIIFALVAVGASWGVVGGAYQVLLPFFGMDVFNGGEDGVGMLYAVQGLGVIIGGLFVKRFISRSDDRMKLTFGWAYLAQGVFFVLFALAPNIWLGLVLLLLMRIAGGVIIPLDTTLIQKYTQQDMIGKVFTLHGSLYMSIMQFSMFLTGVLLKRMSPQMVGTMMGLICCVASVTWLYMYYTGRLRERPQAELVTPASNQTSSAQ